MAWVVTDGWKGTSGGMHSQQFCTFGCYGHVWFLIVIIWLIFTIFLHLWKERYTIGDVGTNNHSRIYTDGSTDILSVNYIILCQWWGDLVYSKGGFARATYGRGFVKKELLVFTLRHKVLRENNLHVYRYFTVGVELILYSFLVTKLLMFA